VTTTIVILLCLQNAAADVEKMILGNKCDLSESRVVSKERGQLLADEHSIKFMETSAKASINVEEVFIVYSVQHMGVCVHVYVCTCVYVHLCTRVCICTCVCICACVYVCVYTCAMPQAPAGY